MVLIVFEPARLSSILYISRKYIDFSNQLITIHDLKKDQEEKISYKSFLTEEMTLLLKEWAKELKSNDKIFYEHPL